jgi:hypothetical protein
VSRNGGNGARKVLLSKHIIAMEFAECFHQSIL